MIAFFFCKFMRLAVSTRSGNGDTELELLLVPLPPKLVIFMLQFTLGARLLHQPQAPPAGQLVTSVEGLSTDNTRGCAVLTSVVPELVNKLIIVSSVCSLPASGLCHHRWKVSKLSEIALDIQAVKPSASTSESASPLFRPSDFVASAGTVITM